MLKDHEHPEREHPEKIPTVIDYIKLIKKHAEDITRLEQDVLIRLMLYGKNIYPGYYTLATEIRSSYQPTRKAVNRLIQKKYLSKTNRVYHINFDKLDKFLDKKNDTNGIKNDTNGIIEMIPTVSKNDTNGIIYKNNKRKDEKKREREKKNALSQELTFNFENEGDPYLDVNVDQVSAEVLAK